MNEQQKTFSLSYRCTWKYFTLGLKDWIKEQFLPVSLRQSQPPERAHAYSLVTLVLVAALFIVTLGFLASLMGPGIASGLTWMGTRTVAAVAVVLSNFMLTCVVVVLPIVAVRRIIKGVRTLCQRGWELSTGVRKPVAIR
jgi:hypothetical protein